MTSSSTPSGSSFDGRSFDSETQAGVRYHVERVLGEGGMGTAYLTRRDGPHGSTPAVVKVMHSLLADGRVLAEMVAAKEAVALGRLNEAVPPTPFVVRYIDSGTLPSPQGTKTPWVAIEYVHGGIEGTTLEDRVTYSVHKTGFGFDSTRAAHALRCLSSGLSAIHAVGVLHRDLTPGNVLCCGFGSTEIFKISDFGVARATGTALTFQGFKVGTIGYAAPESSDATAGPGADIFSLAGVIFYLITGQHYIDAENPLDAMRRISSSQRASIMDHPTLSPELLAKPDVCRNIDRTLAHATARAAAHRPASAEQFSLTLLSALGDLHAQPRSSRRLLSAVAEPSEASPAAAYRWTVRSHPREDLVVHSAAWDTDGHAFALTAGGAQFWNGERWTDARSVLEKLPPGMNFTQRYEAGGWLVGGDNASLSVIDIRGVSSSVTAPASDLRFSLASGRIDDLVVAVGARPGEPPSLWTAANRRWMKPVAVPGVVSISSLLRFDDARWLLGGRMLDGRGFAAIYSPILCDLEPLPVPALRAFIAGAAAPDRSLALLCGSNGVVLRLESGGAAAVVVVPGEPDLSSTAVDIQDREWVTSLGALWSRDPGQPENFQQIWRDASWQTPFVSTLADVGFVVAMTADGGIVEGRVQSYARRVGETIGPRA